MSPRLAIVGATGAVGKELMQLMVERDFPFSDLRLVASKRSAGSRIQFKAREYVVEDLEAFDFSNTDIAFFSAGTATSKLWAGKAAGQGALVIDNTNAFRMDPDSPLVVPQINGHLALTRPKSGIIANPNCSTIQMVRMLDAVEKAFGLERIVVSTYQAASGAGLSGMDELTRGAEAFLKNPTAAFESKKFPKALAFNAVPQVDVFMDNGFTLEEQKMVQETRKILGIPDLRLTATCVRVPVLNGHSEAVYVETKQPLEREALLAAIKGAEEMVVYESLGTSDYPTARMLSSKNHVHVGRVRIDPQDPKAFWSWVVADNLRIGAALNAIQIAEKVVGRPQ